jgi:superfamily II DNA or RNA helicase
VSAPRREIVSQWADEFKTVTGRPMMRLTSSDTSYEDQGDNFCATWASIEGLSDGFQQIFRSRRTLVICDEHHHAAVEATWGRGTVKSFEYARYAIILTGTPIRSDGGATAWMAYDDIGKIDHPEEGTYTISYGEAVDFGYCRPITFHRHEGQFSVVLKDGENIAVSGEKGVELPENLEKIEALQTALDYYMLVRTPIYEADNKTPSRNSYQASMLEWGISKLDDLRDTMPDAGGLVIAPNIRAADYIADLLEILEGERPIIVHTETSNPEERIRVFKNSTKKWIVSVAMISEGVDIKRLRVLIYLPNAQTELAFRQAMGRVVRTRDDERDATRAYVVMPTHKIFEEYARRVEVEMPPRFRKTSDDDDKERPKVKVCPACSEENDISATRCAFCQEEFPPKEPDMKECGYCGALNPKRATECQDCGERFGHDFEITLSDAFRMGTIIRGSDIDEELTQEGEKISPELKKLFLNSGDEWLVDIAKKVPGESMGKAAAFIEQVRKKIDEGE